MATTVITHIYNEAFLLPIWLRHHREKFDHGIIVDYGSTDNAREIVRELTPHWEFRDTGLDSFQANVLDSVINSIERRIVGTRIVLTVTEFLLGQPRRAERRHLIPQIVLINMDDNLQFDPQQPFHKQVTWGLGSDTESTAPWWSRSMHQAPTNYGVDGSMTGRHYHGIDNGEYLIYRVSNCYVSPEMLDRRLQIQHRIPEQDKQQQMGVQHHNWNQGLTLETLLLEQASNRAAAKDLSPLLERYDR